MRYMCLVFCVLTVGCASTRTIDTRSIEYNEAVENSTNVIALKNVVRAKMRLPRIYSRIGSATFQGTFAGKPTAGLTFGGESDGVVPLSMEFTASDSTTANLETQLGQKFYQSILNSVKSSTVKLYRDQGWPDLILFSLFVEKIEFENKAADCNSIEVDKSAILNEVGIAGVAPEEIKKYFDRKQGCNSFIIDNDGDSPYQYFLFRKFLQHVDEKYDVKLSQVDDTSKCGEDLDLFCSGLKGHIFVGKVEEFETFELFKDFKKSDLAIVNGRVYEKLPKKDDLKITMKGADDSSKKTDPKAPVKPALKTTLERYFGSPYLDSAGERQTQNKVDESAKITLRSPDAMIYYLGELLRMQADGPAMSDLCKLDSRDLAVGEAAAIGYEDICAEDNQSPLFLLENDKRPFSRVPTPAQASSRLFEFAYSGTRYWVNGDSDARGRTMQLITLVNEVFALNQESSSPPSVTFIQGVSR